MAQFSVKIIRLNGAVLDENQQTSGLKNSLTKLEMSTEVSTRHRVWLASNETSRQPKLEAVVFAGSVCATSIPLETTESLAGRSLSASMGVAQSSTIRLPRAPL